MDDLRSGIRKRFERVSASLTERQRRLWAGAEADAIGYGGVAAVSDATGMAISTVRKGRDEVRAGSPTDGLVRDRREGGGRKRLEERDSKLPAALEKLVSPTTRGDPESPLRWTLKSTRELAAELTRQGHGVSSTKVGELLRASGYSLQGTSRTKDGKAHPDRDAQFEFIEKRVEEFLRRGLPVISVDAKKKESVGDFANQGREWQPKGKPVRVSVHSFFTEGLPRAIPYGVYDVAFNSGFVNVGTDHDTPTFAAHSIERWWNAVGCARYPNSKELFITADSGGSNSRQSHVWKARLQEFADRSRLTVHVSHFPPGTSKWNKVEHRLFSFISMNWRGIPLANYETVVSLISATTTRKGLTVRAELDEAKYALGLTINSLSTGHLKLRRDAFRGEWNYSLTPRSAAERKRQPPSKKPKVSFQARRERWGRIFLQQIQSGLSVSQFCREHGISRDSFNSTRRRQARPIRHRSKSDT